MGLLSEDDLPTPAMVIDERIVERNLSRLAEYCKGHGLALRPHAKTHKSIHMGRRQVELGAVGLTVAKVGEAEIMRAVAGDLLIGYPALDGHRAGRIAALAKQCTVRVAVDSKLAVDVLSDAAAQAGSMLGMLVDLDVGFRRTGLQDVDSVVALARDITRKPGLRFDGLFFFPGHLKINSIDTNAIAMKGISATLRETVAALKDAGLEAKIVSGGSTPSAYQSHLIPELTEIRPGTYLYSDWNTASAGRENLTLEDCAARIICTVISDAVPGKVVLDAGSKTLTNDRQACDPEHGGYGHLPDHPEARIVRLSEEHGEVDITHCPRPPKLGQRVAVIPNHICPCVNLQDSFWLKTAQGGVRQMPVDTRGKLS